MQGGRRLDDWWAKAVSVSEREGKCGHGASRWARVHATRPSAKLGHARGAGRGRE